MKDSEMIWSNVMSHRRMFQPAYTLRNLFRQRRCHAFTLGLMKSGTTSIDGLFSKHFRSQHEPDIKLMIKLIIDFCNGVNNQNEIRNFYLLREHCMQLEMESNFSNYFFIDILVDLFPSARFILTYRDPLSWVNSMINHTINKRNPVGSAWHKCLEALYMPDNFAYGQEKDLFRRYDLFPMASYLSLWSRTYESLLQTIPHHRLLIVPTEDISFSVGRIAQFLDIEESFLCLRKSHLFKSSQDHDLLAQINPHYLKDTIKNITGITETRMSRLIDKQLT